MNRQSRILFVGNDEQNQSVISKICKKNLLCVFDIVKDVSNMILKTISFSPDLIITEMAIFETDEFAFCRLLKENPRTRSVPILVITANNDNDSKLKAFEAGATDFITQPIEIADCIIRTRNLLRLKKCEELLQKVQGRIETQANKETEALTASLHDVVLSQKQMKSGYLDTIYRLITIAEFKDEAAASHVRRVGLYSAHLAQQLGWNDDQTEMIRYAASMHDIGNVGIPSDILLKHSRLTPEELALVKTHTIIGGNILQKSKSALLRMAEIVSLSHHERWDGTGYPFGLKGEEIPIEGRIVAFADQYDALRSVRPYRPHYDYIKAYRIMVEGDEMMGPQHFDPQLLEIFKNTHKVFESIYDLDQDLSHYERIRTLKPFVLLEQEKIYELITKMTEREYSSGDDIIVQGAKGDCYYIIKSGRIAVHRKRKDSKLEQIDVLIEGCGFGDEALIRDDPSGATYSALEETVVYVLDKADFNTIMKSSFLHNIFVEDMNMEVYRDKYVLVDVRVPHEYEQEHIEGAINIPIEVLPKKYTDLDPSKKHITYCTNDARGLVAAFLLKNHGFNAECLRGGISSWVGPTAAYQRLT